MSLLDDLKTLLQQDPRLTAKGELLKNQVTELALKLDRDLLRLLLSHERLKTHFFVDVDGVLVFDKEKFMRFVNNKAFLPDSYTTFKNKIGLTVGDRYLSESRDVVLSWAYKDCVLEGGQAKEDAKRDEIFWNEILAPEEIDRLFAPKVLTNFKRYDADGEHTVAEFANTDNLVIRGNNLLALQSLKKRFAGRVQLIYIDPPYNTGSDEFKYNDNFTHSTWLTFMRNRLEVARDLLAENGVLFVQCDYHEDAYLRVLMDELFGREKFVQSITVKMSDASGPKMAHAKTNIPKLKDTLLVYCMGSLKLVKIPAMPKSRWDGEYSKILVGIDEDTCNTVTEILLKEEPSDDDWNKVNAQLRDAKLMTLSEFDASKKRDTGWLTENSWRIVADKQNTSLDSALKKIAEHPVQDVAAFRTNRGRLLLYRTDKQFGSDSRVEIVFAKNNLTTNPCDIWLDISTAGGFSEEGGVSLPRGKKPESLLSRIIQMATKPSDIVLDYHLGSGTTAAVAHKLGRQYIGVEQIDYGKNSSVERLKHTISGDTTGISAAVGWQGGGSFVYCELMQWNERFFQQILNGPDEATLQAIWEAMQSKSHLSYRLDLRQFNENAHAFTDLSLDDQRRFLMEVLDKNALYVNLSEMDDEIYGVSDSDKQLNCSFYGV